MTSDYNGWTNYATWNVPLWIDNEEETYRLKLSMLRSVPVVTPEEAARIAEECLGGKQTPDIAGETRPGYRWEDIDWSQIADAWKSEL